MSMYPKNMYFTPESAYGHFGRCEFAWEKVGATEELLGVAKDREIKS
jgi:S-adenosylmethionine synthetase